MIDILIFLFDNGISTITKPNERTVILEDIHECLEFGSSLCKNGRCSNTFGSYMCMCEAGFQLDQNWVGIDSFNATYLIYGF